MIPINTYELKIHHKEIIMELQELIHEIKKSGAFTDKKSSYYKLINALRKDKQLRNKLLNSIDKRLNENLTLREIGLLL